MKNNLVDHLDNVYAHIGMVTFMSKTQSQADVFKCADNAMYEAKNAGRNTIVVV